MNAKPANLKPDLGLHKRAQGYSGQVAQYFYNLELVDIDNRIAKDIFAMLSPEHQSQFLASIHGRNFPFRATLPKPVVLSTVESYLGELQGGAHDSFIPFVIKRVQ